MEGQSKLVVTNVSSGWAAEEDEPESDMLTRASIKKKTKAIRDFRVDPDPFLEMIPSDI